MLKGLLTRVMGDPNEKELNRLQPLVDDINALEPALKNLERDELRAKTKEFRLRLAQGETLDDLLVEAFALVREAAWRTIKLRHYDVQMIGGIVLHQGKIAEMKTGEGKTLVATLPLYLNGLTLNPEWVERAQERWGKDPDRWDFEPLNGIPVGRGVHLVTVNDYLARRDGGWMGAIFHALGLQVGLVIPYFSARYNPDYVGGADILEDDRLVHWQPCARQQAYQADVVYGTNNEFGFDYLRDNMARSLEALVQRELNYAIIDEVDNVLIDEARTPLIISGPAEAPSDNYRRFAQLVRRLRRSTNPEEEEPDGDYIVDEKSRAVTPTESGIEKIERALGIENLYSPEHSDLTPYLDNALRAHVIYQRDKNYIVKDGQVIIVDEFTGRLMHGRRYSEGLHQAIEAKENLAVQRESLTYATITIQNFFRMYRKLSGMTGTAETEAEEFHSIYDLDVTVLPTNVEYRATFKGLGDDGLVERERTIADLQHVEFAGVLNGREDVNVTTYERDEPRQLFFRRLDLPDAIYMDEASKFAAIVQEIKALHQAKRPVLVGTIAVEVSERLSRMLKKGGVPHNVLNAKQHQQEALIIAQAGRPGAVTIATNMAGRGVDILIGGNPEALAARALSEALETQLKQIDLQRGGRIKGVRQETQDTAKGLLKEYQKYQAAARSKKSSSLPVFFAEQLIKGGHVSSRDRGRAVRLARHVLAGEWQDAGKLAQKSQGLSLDTLSQIERLREQFGQADDAQEYMTSGLSSTYHNLLMSLIQLTLRREKEAAHELMAEYPELPSQIIEIIEQEQEKCRRDQEKVRALGGLHVIGTERHDARRIDNQLRGRAGRQGDPGSSRFYLSMEDEMMRRFGGERVQSLMRRTWQEDVPLEFGILSRAVESAQTRVEGYNFDIRKHVIEYDDVINKQREVIYEQRREVLNAKDLRDQVLRMLEETIAELVDTHCVGYEPEEWDLDGLYTALHTFLPRLTGFSADGWATLSQEEIKEQLFEHAAKAYDLFYQAMGQQSFQQAANQEETLAQMRESNDPLRRSIYQHVVKHLGGEPDAMIVERPLRRLSDDVKAQVSAGFAEAARIHRDKQVMLQAVDGLWIRHLTDLDILREGIGLRAYGQRDPLVSFKKEAHEMYQGLLGAIQTAVVHNLFRVPVASRPSPGSDRRRRSTRKRRRKRKRRR